MERERIDNIEVLEYVLFCIEGIAEKGKDYIVEDILDVMRKRGLTV